MIRGLFKATTRLLHPHRSICNSNVVHLQRFCFSRVTLHPTIQKIQSGINAKSVKTLVAELQILNEKDKEHALKVIIEEFDKKNIAVDLIKNEHLGTLAKPYPQIFIQIKQRYIEAIEIELLEKIGKGKLNSTNMSSYLDKFVNTLHQWAQKLTEIKDQERAFYYSIHLNRSHTYLFEKYISKHLPEQKKQAAYRQLCEWNKNLLLPMRSVLQKTKTRLLQQKEDATLSQLKAYFLQNMQAFTSNILFSYQARNQIFMRNNNQKQYVSAQKELNQNLIFIMSCYETLGFEDLQYFTINFIQLNRISTFMTFSQNQLTNIQNPNQVQAKKIKGFINQEMDRLCGKLISCFGKIKNKESDVSRLIEVAMPVLGLRIDQAKMTVQRYKELEERLQIYKEEILSKVQNSIARKILAQKFEIEIMQHLKQMKGQLR